MEERDVREEGLSSWLILALFQKFRIWIRNIAKQSFSKPVSFAKNCINIKSSTLPLCQLQILDEALYLCVNCKFENMKNLNSDSNANEQQANVEK